MRKMLILSGLLICVFVSRGQVDNAQRSAALQLVKANSISLGMSLTDINDAIVSATYRVTGTDITMVYLQQSYLGIPVYNQMQVLAFKNGQLVSNAGSRLPGMEKLTLGNNEVPAISAVQALRSAFAERNIIEKELPVPVSNSVDGHVFEFGRLGVATENIKTELMWLPGENNLVRLAWQVHLAPNSTPDLWLIRIDAKTGSYIDKTNLTITCNWDNKKHSVESHLAETHFKDEFNGLIYKQSNKDWRYRPFIVSDANYTVIKYPAESPQHAGGTPSVDNKPWLLTPGNATSLGWHDDGTTINESTKGNNVWAQEDRDNNNNTFGNSTTSATSQPTLNFPNVYNFTLSPTEATLNNQRAAVTNLFYWNNLLHDISYAYGFDEVSGNFQNSNQGRGGLGSDYVIADAQDAGNTNNADFGTPDDGISPRMQMYLFTSTSPNRDGDLDNGIISHEYTHGISNRLTGGPANSSCLINTEQGGEGWSDYFALMMTTNWTTASVNDGPLARSIGTYALGQPLTGPGFRHYPYSTNLNVNPLTYSFVQSSGGEAHNIGEVWCMALWEMTWEIIKQDNAINTNLFVPGPVAFMTGNSSALKLVVEGMRLQPCNPGFLDARNAILKADTLFFNKKYSCSIWKAFAKRGMGRNASQGSSNSTSDQIVDFTADASALALNINSASVPETQNIVYTNKVTSIDCMPITNFTLRDTLPANVTYVSGGSYNPANRVVSFNPVTVAAGTTQAYTFTVNVNAGTYFPAVSIIDEPVAGAAIPAFWTETSTTATHWTVSNVQSHSAPNSFFTANPGSVSDQVLTTANSFSLDAVPPPLSFWHFYNTESGWDGAVVEISLNGGATWSDIGAANFITGGYNSTLFISGNPLSGRAAFTGNSGGFIKSTINMTPYANQANVKLRFRFGSDQLTGGTGWYVDDIEMKNMATVNMRTSLFDASNNRISKADTITMILPVNGCPGPVAGVITEPTCAVPTGSVLLTGLPATGTWIINPGAVTGTGISTTITGLAAGTYNFTVTNEGGCTSIPSANVIINAAPVIPSADAVGNQAVCNTTATTAVNFTGPVAGTVFNWTNNNTSTGLTASGTGNIPSFTAVNTGNAPVTSTVTVTPSFGGFAYISNYASNDVSVINTAANSVVATIPVGSNPGGVSVNPDGSRVYVSNYGSGVSVINTITNSVVATIAVEAGPDGLSVSPDGSRVYVANSLSNTVSVINTITNSVVATVPVGFNPLGVSVSPDGSKVYVANYNSGNVSVINTATNSVLVTIPAGSGPYGISVSPDGQRVYVANQNSSTLSVINTATNLVVATVSVGNNPYGISVSPDGSRVYISNHNGNTVSVINTATNLLIATIPVGNNPNGISVSPDGSRVYVANHSSNNLSVINTATNLVVATVSVGIIPTAFGNFIAGDVCTGASKTFTITVNPIVTITPPTLIQPACAVPTGTIIVNATTGAGAAEYSIDNGTNWQLNSTFSNLTPGSYNIKVRLQGSGCVTTYADNPVVLNIAACNTKTIPGRIEAESYDAKFGPLFAIPTTDASGGQQVVGITNGNWMDYNVFVNTAGFYKVKFRIATAQSTAQFLIQSGNTTAGTVNIHNTGEWNIWAYDSVNVSLTAGTQTLRILSNDPGSCNFNWMDWMLTSSGTSPTANAGPNQAITLPASQVTLTGNGSPNNGGTITGYAWTRISGPNSESSVPPLVIQTPNNAGTIVSGLIQGVYTFRLTVTRNDNQTATNDVTVTVSPANTSTPFTGTRKPIPGKLEAEEYDNGGQSIAYFDGTATNSGGVFRPAESVDIRTCPDIGGGYCVGWTTDGEWLKYSVNVTTTGAYTFTARIASPNTGKSIQFEVDGTVIGTLTVLNTGGFNNWQTATLNNVSLIAGDHVFRFLFNTGDAGNTDQGFDINWFNFDLAPTQAPTANAGPAQTITLPISQVSLSGSGAANNGGTITGYAWTRVSGPNSESSVPPLVIQTPTNAGTIVSGLIQGIYTFRLTVTRNDNQTATSDVTVTVNPANTSTPYTGTRKPIPGKLEAEEYDNGGQNIAYFDGTTVNSGQVFRPAESVDIRSCPDIGGGYCVGWTTDGEWLKYSVNVTTTGAYIFTARIGSPNTGKSIQFQVDGNTVGTLTVQNTGGFNNWQTATLNNVTLTAGDHIFRFLFNTGDAGNTDQGFDINWFNFDLAPTQSPTANAGPAQTITLPISQISLSGSGSANNGGTITGYVWTRVSGPNSESSVPPMVIQTPTNASTIVSGLIQGIYTFRLIVTRNDNQTATSDVTVTVNPANTSTPYTGTRKPIPGKLEAEEYDNGGQNIAYFDGTTVNSGQAFRPAESVDIRSCPDIGGGYCVGWTTEGEWLKYSVNVTTTGIYTFTARIASPNTGKSIQFQVDGNTVGTLTVQNTGGFNNWQTAILSNLSLTAGDHVFRFLLNTGDAANPDLGFDINWFNFGLTAPVTTVNIVPVIDAPVQKKMIAKELLISVFPNPAESYFNLKVLSKSMELVTIRVIDITGRQVQQLQGIPGQTLRFGDQLVNGTYIVEVRQGSQREVTKVVKQ